MSSFLASPNPARVLKIMRKWCHYRGVVNGFWLVSARGQRADLPEGGEMVPKGRQTWCHLPPRSLGFCGINGCKEEMDTLRVAGLDLY